MMRTRISLAVGGAAAALVLAGLPAGAQAPPTLPLTVSPTGGPAGTVVSFSGEGCGNGGDEFSVVYSLIPWDGVTFPIAVADGVAAPGADGSWTGQVTVPEGLDPNLNYLATAVCVVEESEGQDTFAFYEAVPFDVTGGSPTVPPADPPAVPVEPADALTPGVAPVAPAAVAVPGDPSYTG